MSTSTPDYAALAAQMGGSYVAPASPTSDSQPVIPSSVAAKIPASALPAQQTQTPAQPQVDYEALARQAGGSYVAPPTPTPTAVAGEQINDVGHKVIVPKPGESFADTMNRARQYGTTVTQGQVNKEMATAPEKVGEVLTAASLPSAAAGVARAAGTAGYYGGVVPAVKAWMQNNPELIKAAITAAKSLERGGPIVGLGWLLYKAAASNK